MAFSAGMGTATGSQLVSLYGDVRQVIQSLNVFQR